MDAIPPLVTPLLTAVINDPTMPAALLRSYARLFAAAWRNDYRHTDRLHFETQLLPLLGVRRSQARQQLRALRFAKLLDWSSDGNNHYVIHFHPPPEGKFSGKTDRVGVGVDSQNQILESIQQQTTGSEKARARLPLDDAAHPLYQQVSGYLLRAGVWEEVVERIARQMLDNQRRIEQGQGDNLPCVEDVLGWMAYCFADRQKNKIAQPAAVLAANLNANRRCPEEYRPPRVCANCGYQEDYCDCDDEHFQPHFPPEFLERAFRSSHYEAYLSDRWGICQRCHAFPCRC